MVGQTDTERNSPIGGHKSPSLSSSLTRTSLTFPAITLPSTLSTCSLPLLTLPTSPISSATIDSPKQSVPSPMLTEVSHTRSINTSLKMQLTESLSTTTATTRQECSLVSSSPPSGREISASSEQLLHTDSINAELCTVDSSPPGARKKLVPVVPTAIANVLPPCRVCHEKASGFHYGVNTCEACKGFFRRSLQRKDKYKCPGGGGCAVGGGRRGKCAACRFNKCITIGMSKSAIKTGRYTHEKRTQDILEVKQLKFSRIIDDTVLTSDISTSTSSKTPISTSLLMASTRMISEVTSSTTQLLVCTSPLSPSQITPAPPSPDSETQLFANCVDVSSSQHDNLLQQSVLAPSQHDNSLQQSDLDTDSLSSGFSESSSLEIINNSPIDTVDHNSEVDRYILNFSSLQSIVDSPMFMSLGQGSDAEYEETKNVIVLKDPDSRDECWPELQALPDITTRPASPVHEKEDMETIINKLVAGYKKNVHHNMYTPVEVLHARQQKHYDLFQRREEMFGSLSTLTHDQYTEIYEKTGIDVDNRQEMMNYFAKQMECGLKKYIMFAKIIPGFTDLHIDDQANLIKTARFEFCFLGNFSGYNRDLMTVAMSSGVCLHLNEICKLCERAFVVETFRMAERFQQLGLIPDEMVVVKCICVMYADRCRLRDKFIVENIQCTLVQCLLHMLEKNHSSPGLLLAKLTGRLTELRSLSEWNNDIVRNFQIWPAIQQSPLMLEVFSI